MSWTTETLLRKFSSPLLQHDARECVPCRQLLVQAEIARKYLREGRTGEEDLLHFADECRRHLETPGADALTAQAR